MIKYWTAQELQILRNEYPTKGINIPISRTPDAIMDMAKKLKIKKDIWGKNNPHWKGDSICISAARVRAQRLLNTPKDVDIHHKDGNPHNNDPTNLQIVSRREHMMIDGRLEKIIKRNKNGLSEEIRRKISEHHADFSGEKNPNWRGGITLIKKSEVKTKEI